MVCIQVTGWLCIPQVQKMGKEAEEGGLARFQQGLASTYSEESNAGRGRFDLNCVYSG